MSKSYFISAMLALITLMVACSNESKTVNQRGERISALSSRDIVRPDASSSPTPDPTASPTGSAQAQVDANAVVAAIAKNVRIVGLEDTPQRLPFVIDEAVEKFITIGVKRAPTLGTIETIDARTLSYAPPRDYAGSDKLEVVVSFVDKDQVKAEATAEIEIVMTSVNDFPQANDTSLNVAEDTAVNFQLLASDIDSDPLTFEIVQAPKGGAIENFDARTGKGRYVPKANQTGSDFFKFQVSDNSGAKATAFGLVTLNEVNDPPVAVVQSIQTNEDQAVTFKLQGIDPDSNNLTFARVQSSGPNFGTITLNAATGEVLYVPTANRFGSDKFSFVVSDGQATSAAAEVSISVQSINDAPVFIDSLAMISPNEDSPVSFQLEVSDIETPENLSFVLVSSPEKGSIKSEITVNAQKRAFLSITFAPSLDAVGADEFSYQLSDGSAVSILRTTAVSITPVNDPPIAPNFVVNGGSGASINITVQAQDPDAGDVLYYDVNAQKQPLLGSVTVDGDPTAGKFTYTVRPGTPANAVDSFGYIVRDRLTGGLNASGTITVNIARQNNAPVANAGSVNGTEDTDRPFNLSASDPDGDPLVYRIVAGQGPANGEIVNFNSSTGAGIYRPRTNFSGNDTFKFEVTDGIATSSSATVSVTVSAVNDAPTIRQVGIFSVAEDQNATEVPLALSDVDNSNQVFTLEVVQQSSPNLVTIEGQKFFYRPKLDFNGIDSFIVRISDGQLKSEDLPVFVFVTATNDDPVAAAATYNILEDRTLAESLPATDIDSTALSATIVQQPTSGNVTITPNSLSFQYTPPANFSGSATFSYRVTDGSAQSNTAVVTIIVGEINDPPTASNVNASGNEDTDIAGSFAATDPDTPQANLSFLISRQPNNGTVVVSGKNFSYRGKQDFNGADSFEFVASDGQAFSAAATVSVNVTPINDPPVLPYSMPFRTPEDMAQDFEIKVVDPDDATVTLTLELVSRSAIGGALTINQATVSYSPTTNFFGEFKFSLQAKDPTGATSAVQNYSILVEPVNDAPVVPAKLEFNASEGRALAGQLSAVDVDRDSLQFVATSSPSSGTVVINQASGMFTYTPNANFNGTDQFRYRVTDGLAFSNEGLVEISVVPVNDPPTGTPQDLQLDEDTFIEFSLQGVDPEGGALQFFTLPPANGQLTRIGVGTNMFRYNPNLNFNGKDSFHFVVSDGVNQSSPAKVEIDVKPINDPPSIENFEARGPKNQEIRFKPVVSDVDGDTLTLVIKTQGERGEASIDGEFVVYDPSPGFTGTDTVKITVSDGTVEGNVADGIFIVEDPNP